MVTDGQVQVQGQVTGESAGEVEVSFFQADRGEGELSTPLAWVDSLWVADPSDWSHTLLYPEDAGEGLVVYAWEDADGDGIFCGVGAEGERSGLVEVEDFPAFEVSVTLTLDAVCLGPEGLYP